MTAVPGKSLLEKLGIAAEDVEVLATVPAPQGAVAHGLAGPLPAARDLSDTFVELLPPDMAARLPFLLAGHALDPRVVRVEIEDGPETRALHGATFEIDGGVLLDGRGENEAGCAIEASGEVFLVEIRGQAVTVFRRRAPNAWAPLPDRFEVPPPSVQDLLAGHACEAWLRERAEGLASAPTLVERAAAVGVVVRLWEPTAKDREAISTGEAIDPSVPATAWIKALGDSRAALVHVSLHRAASLREAFDALPELDADPSDDDVLEMLLERDALESVRVVLSFAGEGLSLARALVLTDDVATTVWSAIAPSDRLRNEPLLRAVLRCEPGSFWGRIVET